MIPAWGGNDYYACRELARRGHDVTLFTSDLGPGRYYATWYWSLNRFGKHEEVVDGFKVVRSRALANLGGDMPLTPILPLEMRSVEADVIHAHEFYNLTSLAAYVTAVKKHIPFTYTQERYYSVKRRAWRIPYSVTDRAIMSHIRKHPRYATAFSTSAKEFLAGLGYPEERIVVIPMGVDTKAFHPRAPPTLRKRLGLDSEPLILTVARLHQSKGLTHLLSAMRRIVDEVREARLAVVGRGPEEQALKSQVERLGLQDNVSIITEHITHREMPGVYSSCDLFVLPSIYEPFGSAAVEALATGKPIVATRVGGLRDIVVNEQTGFHVSPRDSNTLSERVALLLRDHGLRRRMGEKARRRAVDIYDWSIVAERYEALYNKLLE
jgi:glycosyltransferase involved in cell wall biosynthesis